MTLRVYKLWIVGAMLVTILPFLVLFTEIDFTLLQDAPDIFWANSALVVGNTFGLMGILILWWEFLLGIRFLVKIFTPDLVWVMDVHKWFGKYGTLLIFLHGFLLTYAYWKDLVWVIVPDFSSYSETLITLGKFAFIALLVVWVTSALIRERMHYRTWLYLHYLSYPIVLFTYLHTIDLGSFLYEYPLLKGVWVFTGITFLLMSVYRFAIYAGLIGTKYEILESDQHSEDIWIMRFKALTKTLHIEVGQYIYLQLRGFGEAHPFTVMEFDNQKGGFLLGIKVVGSFTQKLATLQVGDTVTVDGPYGVFTQEGQNDQPKVILAGGIGITPFIELVKQYSSPSTLFFNCNRYQQEALYSTELSELLDSNYFEFISREPKRPDAEYINYGRISAAEIARILSKKGLTLGSVNYFICGSKKFITGITTDLTNQGVNEHQILAEKFF